MDPVFDRFTPLALDGFAVNCVQFAAFSILLYDWFSTFTEEVDCVWRHVKSVYNVFFLLTRYGTLLGFGAVCYFSIFPPPYEGCGTYIVIRETFFATTSCPVLVMASMRVYALYNRSRFILFLFVVAWVLDTAINVWGFVDADPTQHFVSPFFGCHQINAQADSVNLSIPWIGNLALDAMLLALIASRVFLNRRKEGPSMFTSRTRGVPLMNMLMRDGLAYFVGIAITTVPTVLLIFLGPPALKTLLTSLTASLPVVMIQRMSLHMHKSAEATRAAERTVATWTKGATLTTIVIPDSESYWDETGSEFEYDDYVKGQQL